MRTITLTLLLLLLTGCDNAPKWQTHNIDGLMPKLEFNLTDENGKAVTASHYTGTVNLLFFGFTHCQDVCPATLGEMKVVLNQLPQNQARRVRVLFVSVDPKRDTPRQLQRYTAAFGDQFIGLTGTPSQLDKLTKRYRTTYGYGKPDANGDYEVSHGSGIYVFDTEGKARLLMQGSDSLAAMQADLSRLVNGAS